jgi:hypothetical protein
MFAPALARAVDGRAAREHQYGMNKKKIKEEEEQL